MTDEERDTEPMALTGAVPYRRGGLWWKAAVGLLLSGALILGAVWIRLESRPLERQAPPLASSSALEEAVAGVPSRPGTAAPTRPADS